MTIANRKGITVRFEDNKMAQLDELATRYHVSSATIIRWALKALADYVQINNGRIVLPLDFTTFYDQASKFPAMLQVAEEPLKPQPSPATPSASTPARGVKYPTGKTRRKKA